MILIDDAHQYLEEFCKDEPGVALGDELFTYLVREAIKNSNSSSLEFPSSTEFENMQIKFAGEIDSSKMTITIEKKSSSSSNENIPEITLKDVSFTIKIYLSDLLMSEHPITYSKIVGGVSISTEHISVNGEESIGSWGKRNEPWRNMAKLPNNDEFTQELKENWSIQEKAVELVAKDLLGPTLLQSINIPNIIKMISAINFVGPVRIGAESGLIMFAGPAQWTEQCPRRKAIIQSTSIKTKDESSSEYQRSGIVNINLSDEDPNKSYPKQPERPHLKDADVFAYLPQVFVEKRFDGIAKPAVGFNDGGYIGPISWHYECALQVKLIMVSMTSMWPLEFKLEIPANAFGVAGAGVKLGCIYYEAVGLAFNGEIDPLEIYFLLGQDTNTGELYFESRFGKIDPRNFQFHHWPNVKFPMDQIGDIVLKIVAEQLIKSRVGALLSLTRFSLVEYEIVRGFGKMLSGMAAKTSSLAATIGVKFQR